MILFTRYTRNRYGSLKNDPVYRAKLTELVTRSLANSFDGELFELLIAIAAGQKDATIELKVPKHYNPQKDIDLYLTIADIGTGLEKKITVYNIGTPRKDIAMVVDPYLYTRMIKSLGGFYLAIEKALSFIQNENIEASKISGITIIRHIFLDNVVNKEVSHEKGFYDFTGYRAIIYYVAAPFLTLIMNSVNGVINKDTGNYRIIHRIVYGKGAIFGDLVRVIKDPSTAKKPLPFERMLVEKKDDYNSNYGFKDQYIEIPDTLDQLHKNYDKSNLIGDPNHITNPPEG